MNKINQPVAEPDVPVVDVVSTKLREVDPPLYMSRNRVYPRRVSGTFRRVKWMVLAVLLGIYYLVPWVRWDRGPDAPNQAVLIDMPARRAYFLWIEIWPQEIYFLAGLLILAALALFLVTSIAGRVWCGYTCPQTVWTDLFMWVERRIEGDRNARMRLDRTSFNLRKAVLKVAKHSVWLLISVLTGGAWIMYFNDAPTVLPAFITGQAGKTVYLFVGLFTATTYVLAGWAREQVCTYMCPWPRFQAALFDEDTLIVSYQNERGEPRGHHKKGQDWGELGHCVDCNQCVAVCPTGIDIRDGQQLECISCALCIDACNTVMAKVGLPGNLISYDTERRQESRIVGTDATYRLLRPRTLLYGALCLIAAGLLLWGLTHRTTLEINVLHDRNPLFVMLSDGSVRNGYTIRLLNKVREERQLILQADGLPGAALQVTGQETTGRERVALLANPDGVTTYHVFVKLPRGEIYDETIPFSFTLTAATESVSAAHETVFRGPTK